MRPDKLWSGRSYRTTLPSNLRLRLMPHTHYAAFSCPVVLLILVFTAAVYLRGWLHVRSSSANVVARWRAGSFLFGLFVVWGAVASPIAGYVHELLTAHMLQHLLLLTIAPPLIWLGAPTLPLVYGLPQNFLGKSAPLLGCTSMRWLANVIRHPVVCWLAAAATLIIWHIPVVLTLGAQSQAWHHVAEASFLAAGLLFWWPLLQPSPSVGRTDWLMVVYLFLATLPCDILSGFLVFCDRVVYPMYSSSSHPFGLSPLDDQRCAGALMWTCVTVVYLIAGSIFTARLLSPQSSRAYANLQPDSQTVLQIIEVL